MPTDSIKYPISFKILIAFLLLIFAFSSIFGFLSRNVPLMMITLAVIALVVILSIRFDSLVPFLIFISAAIPLNVKGMMITFGDFSIYTAELILYLTLGALFLTVIVSPSYIFITSSTLYSYILFLQSI